MLSVIFWIFGALILFYFFNKYQNRYQSFQGNVFNVIVVGLLLFFVLTAIYVYISSKPDVGSFQGTTAFLKVYFSWLGSFFTGTRDVVGYAVNYNWGVNSSIG